MEFQEALQCYDHEANQFKVLSWFYYRHLTGIAIKLKRLSI